MPFKNSKKQSLPKPVTVKHVWSNLKKEEALSIEGGYFSSGLYFKHEHPDGGGKALLDGRYTSKEVLSVQREVVSSVWGDYTLVTAQIEGGVVL